MMTYNQLLTVWSNSRINMPSGCLSIAALKQTVRHRASVYGSWDDFSAGDMVALSKTLLTCKVLCLSDRIEMVNQRLWLDHNRCLIWIVTIIAKKRAVPNPNLFMVNDAIHFEFFGIIDDIWSKFQNRQQLIDWQTLGPYCAAIPMSFASKLYDRKNDSWNMGCNINVRSKITFHALPLLYWRGCVAALFQNDHFSYFTLVITIFGIILIWVGIHGLTFQLLSGPLYSESHTEGYFSTLQKRPP